MIYIVINAAVGGLIGFLIWEIRRKNEEIKRLKEIRVWIDKNTSMIIKIMQKRDDD